MNRRNLVSSYLLIFLLALCFSSASFSKTIIKRYGDKIVYTTPWAELSMPEKIEAAEDAKNYIQSKLANIVTSEKARDDISAILTKEAEIDAVINDATRWIESSNEMYLGIRLTDVKPTGFFITIGGAFSANLKIGGGAGGNIGFVFVPSKIQIYNIRKKQITSSYFTLKPAIIGMGNVDVGGGIGGGSCFRVGFGVIWGALTSPDDFRGVFVGISGTTSFGFGQNTKVFLLKNSSKDYIQNVAFMTSWESGPVAEVSFHGTTGAIIPLSALVKLIFPNDGSENVPTASP